MEFCGKKGGSAMPEERPPEHKEARERAMKLEKDKQPPDARKWAKQTDADNITAP